MEKSTIRLLGVISGIFFIIGGLLIAFALQSLGSVLASLGGTNVNAGAAELTIGGIGTAIGVIIILLSSTLVMSSTRSYRIIAGIIIIVIGLFGSIYTLGGLLIGIILALIAGIMAMAHREETNAPNEFGSPQQ